jgi:hypothetical protein
MKAKFLLALVITITLTIHTSDQRVLAQKGGGYDLTWNTVTASEPSHFFNSESGYELSGMIGQYVAGNTTGGGYTLSGGFWYLPNFVRYMPRIFRTS